MAWGWDNGRAILGVIAIFGIAFALSERKKLVRWDIVGGAIGLQIALLLLLFAVPAIRGAIFSLNGVVAALQQATREGTTFVFGFIGGGVPPFEVANPNVGPSFAFQILPFVMVISTLSAILWHWRILEWIIRGFALLFERALALGGATSLGVAANIFMGMIEAPVLIRPYIDKLTRSELFVLMTVGFATVAGSVLVLLATILQPIIEGAVGHLLVASILACPGGVALAKVMIPEEAGVETTGRLREAPAVVYYSTMDALAKGVQDGLRLLLAIGGMLLVTIALVALVNSALGAFPDIAGAPITLQRVFGLIFSPLMWLMGVPWAEAQTAGALMGLKTAFNEVYAYLELAKLGENGLSDRSQIIVMYALCGFANLGSIGIITAGFTALTETRREEMLHLAPRALIPGTLATCLTGAIAGLMPASVFGL